VVLLGAGVLGATLFKRLGLGSVLGYFAGGLVIGPSGLGWFTDPQAMLHVAELGVVMFLFLIGLEMKPSRLWNLRRQIFGLGVAQVVACGALLTGVGVLSGLPPLVAFLAAAGFVLSSTAAVMQILEERGESSTPSGQQAVAILLLEDLAIVPLLALIALLAPGGDAGAAAAGPGWQRIAVPLAAIVALVAAGRWLLNPLFRVLAALRAREVMTAAALLVVRRKLGAAEDHRVGEVESLLSSLDAEAGGTDVRFWEVADEPAAALPEVCAGHSVGVVVVPAPRRGRSRSGQGVAGL